MLIIVLWMSGHPGNRCQWKTKALTAAAHLAVARSQKIGNGISGLPMKKRSHCIVTAAPFSCMLDCVGMKQAIHGIMKALKNQKI